MLYQLSYCGVPRGLAPSGAGEKGGGEIRGAGARALRARVALREREQSCGAGTWAGEDTVVASSRPLRAGAHGELWLVPKPGRLLRVHR